MATTLSIDDEIANRLRTAIKKKYPDSFGRLKTEVRTAIENHIKLLTVTGKRDS